MPQRRPRRALAGGALLATGALLLGVGPGGPAAASKKVSQAYPVPSGGTYTLTGHGYGHGHGMSQYGAQGAARQGLSYREILRFYYPGTSIGSGAGEIRVLITADTDNDVRVEPATGLKVREVTSGSAYTLPKPAGTTQWRLRTSGGATVLEYYDGAWHGYRPGGTSLSGAAEFDAKGPLTLRLPSGSREYRGALRLVNNDTVNVLPIDDYVQGVVPREMPASWLPAAVRAQAVAARTYAAWERAAHASRYYQTCDTTSCQVYGGVSSEDSRSNDAVQATAGEVLLYAGKPAFTQFSSSSGGWTSAGSMSYLPAKADPYDNFSGNPMHTWTTKLAASRISAKWPSLGKLRRIVVTQRDGNGDWSGRIESMTLDGSKKDVVVSGTTFRSAFGLRSQWFTLGATAASTKEPAPAKPAPAPSASPITARWEAIGGATSVLGKPRGEEYAVPGGRARKFRHGRIYYSASTGAHELYGKVLRPYLRRGGAKSSGLGLPTTEPKSFKRGQYALFEHGKITAYRSGRVRVFLS